MLSSKIKDLKIRQRVKKNELNKNLNKFLFINTLSKKNLNPKLKKKAVVYFTKQLHKGESRTRVTRRCVLTNRSRVAYRFIGISRVALKEMLKAGVLPGYSKAMW